MRFDLTVIRGVLVLRQVVWMAIGRIKSLFILSLQMFSDLSKVWKGGINGIYVVLTECERGMFCPAISDLLVNFRESIQEGGSPFLCFEKLQFCKDHLPLHAPHSALSVVGRESDHFLT